MTGGEAIQRDALVRALMVAGRGRYAEIAERLYHLGVRAPQDLLGDLPGVPASADPYAGLVEVVCGGAEEQYDDHVRYCVPLQEEVERRAGAAPSAPDDSPALVTCPLCGGRGRIPFVFGACAACAGTGTLLPHQAALIRGGGA